jgi:hypothetical protein
LLKPHYQCYIVVFLNRKFDLYKEQVLKVDDMEHEHEAEVGMTF